MESELLESYRYDKLSWAGNEHAGCADPARRLVDYDRRIAAVRSHSTGRPFRIAFQFSSDQFVRSEPTSRFDSANGAGSLFKLRLVKCKSSGSICQPVGLEAMVVFRTTEVVRLRPSAFGLCLLLMGNSICAAENSGLQSKSLPSIEISPTVATVSKRSVTLDDMVSFREVHEPRQSPDGHKMVFLVKQAFRRCDCYRTAIYLTHPEEGGFARKLIEGNYIANLQWSPDGRYISYLSSQGGSVQLWRLDPVTFRAERIFVHTANRDRSAEHAAYQSRYRPASGVINYQWSPDGSKIAFISEPPSDPSIAAEAAKKGFRYDDATMSALDLTVGDWSSARRSKQLWLYDIRRKQ